MREYNRMWKVLHREMGALHEGTLARMLTGTKDDFDRHKGAIQVIEEIMHRMVDIEEQALFNTLPETEGDDDGRSDGPTTGE